VNPAFGMYKSTARGVEQQRVRSEPDFDMLSSTLAKLLAGGLIIGPFVLFSARSEQLAVLAVRHTCVN